MIQARQRIALRANPCKERLRGWQVAACMRKHPRLGLASSIALFAQNVNVAKLTNSYTHLMLTESIRCASSPLDGMGSRGPAVAASLWQRSGAADMASASQRRSRRSSRILQSDTRPTNNKVPKKCIRIRLQMFKIVHLVCIACSAFQCAVVCRTKLSSLLIATYSLDSAPSQPRVVCMQQKHACDKNVKRNVMLSKAFSVRDESSAETAAAPWDEQKKLKHKARSN
eukprot:2171459-Pleurochrysis_carterae.AAC.1